MNYLSCLPTPVQSIFWTKQTSFIKQFLLILLGVLILAIASQISIPIEPVPLTFQSTTVILIGMTYGARKSVYVVLSYLLAGLFGLPVFTDFSSGMHVFLGPTSGYLLGFLPAAFLSGYLAEKGFGKNNLLSFIAACLGDSIIFGLGVMGLALSIGWEQAVALGLMPFIISELMKLLAMSYLVPSCWKKLTRGH